MQHTTVFLERTIDSSHVIPDHPGKCSRLHGHTYRFEVWISGPVAADGFVVDFLDVKELIDAWDHRHLNDIVDVIPTAENLAALMRERILEKVRSRFDDASRRQIGCKVRLHETASAYAEVGWLTPDPEMSLAVGATASAIVNAGSL
jgi:6-pyruvoyltetrahydropterin/6-carboxytetrahydropterin synthase